MSQPTYLDRLRKYASDETRDYLGRDIAIEILAAFLLGLISGGWTWAALLHGVVAFLVLFVGAYLIHFGHAFGALDRQVRGQLEGAGSLLEAERAKNELPEIRGEISEVYFKSAALVEKETVLMDLYITVRAYLTNKRTPATVKRYELTITTDKREYYATEIPLDSDLRVKREERQQGIYGMPVSERKFVLHELTSLDHFKRTPLVKGEGHEGWLRFVLPALTEGAGAIQRGVVSLIITDAFGGVHKIVSEPPHETSGELVSAEREEIERIAGKVESAEQKTDTEEAKEQESATPKADTALSLKTHSQVEHELANFERNNLYEFVWPDACEVNTSPLIEGKRYVDFDFSIHNLSMFMVSVKAADGTMVEGPIKFKNEVLGREARIFKNEAQRISPGRHGHFTIRQWVHPEEVQEILETQRTAGNKFDFSDATVRVGIDGEQGEGTKLDLTRHMPRTEQENKLLVLNNEYRRAKEGLTLFSVSMGKLAELNRTLGIFYRAYNQLEQREVLTSETGNSLKGRFMSALQDCFGDNRIVDAYADILPAMPKSINKQLTWVDAQCRMLRRLIDEQRQVLADYIKDDPVAPAHQPMPPARQEEIISGLQADIASLKAELEAQKDLPGARPLSEEIISLHRRSDLIVKLSLALGGAYTLAHLYEAGEPPPNGKELIEHWLNSTLRGHIRQDHLEAVCQDLPELTDSPVEQKELIDKYCFKLRRLIAAQHQEQPPSDQNEGSTPNS